MNTLTDLERQFILQVFSNLQWRSNELNEHILADTIMKKIANAKQPAHEDPGLEDYEEVQSE